MREVLHGRVWTERPVTVIADDGVTLVTHLRAGTVTRLPRGVARGEVGLRLRAGGAWDLEDRVFAAPDFVRLARFGDPFEVFAIWGDDGGVAGWYVNFQDPLRRVEDGFETLDHLLDLEVSPDCTTWARKDEDELEMAVHMGLYDRAAAQRIDEHCAQVERSLATGACPWDRRWATWRPGSVIPSR
jgi:hypothetical protein